MTIVAERRRTRVGRIVRAQASGRAVRFVLVGLSGVLPNLVALWALTAAGLAYQLAAVLSIQVAIAWNFAGAERFVWQDRVAEQRRRRLAKYVAVGELDLLRVPFVVLLVEWVGLSSLVATVLTLGASFVLRFVLADRLVFTSRLGAAPAELIVGGVQSGDAAA